jgi:hypothetical protein
MIARGSSLDQRLADDAAAGGAVPVPVLVGGCGSGRTERLRRLHATLGDGAQYIDLERVATTPERCHQTIVADSPFVVPDAPAETPRDARAAFDALLSFFMRAAARDGRPATFLLDEVLEMRTFESFPGLRTALAELSRAIAHSPNRFVVATRFSARASRWIATVPERFEIVPLVPLPIDEVREWIDPHGPRTTARDEADDVAHAVHTLVGGQPGYVKALIGQMTVMRASGATDPISALAASMSDGELASRCRFSYELRLHRARGYGALKAIVEVLACEEPLTLTLISQRIGRTPGSTKDYLSWLLDVDLVTCVRKRYRLADPLIRLWVRINRGPSLPDEDRVIGEVQQYALDRLREAPPAALVAAAGSERTRSFERTPALERPGAERAARSGIIEID